MVVKSEHAGGDMASARRTLFGELCAEFAGTLIPILFGVGVVAQVVTSHGAFGDHDSIAWGWGLGVVLGIYTAGHVLLRADRPVRGPR